MVATPKIESAAATRQTRLAITIIAFGLAITLVGGWLSEGMHHFDDLAHFLMAKWAWQDPRYLVYDWARPGFTILYVIPAQLGWHAARNMSALLSALTAWLAFRLGQRCRIRNAALIPLLLYAQPLFFELALTTLTETAFAFFLVLSLDLASRARWSLSAAVLSIAFVTRHEAIALLPIWIVFALIQRVPVWRLWPLPWAVIIVNILARCSNLPLAAARWIDPSPHAWYGTGGWLTMTARALQAWGPAIAALAFAGLPILWQSRIGRMLVACLVALFTLLTAIRALGLFESGGYARFLVPLSPLIAIAAAAAIEQLWNNTQLRRRTALLAAVAFAIMLVAVELQARRPETPAGYPQLHSALIALRIATAATVLVATLIALTNPKPAAPSRAFCGLLMLIALLTDAALLRVLRPGPAEQLVVQELNWLRQSGLSDRPIISAHVLAEYLAGVSAPAPNRPGLAGRVKLAPAGAILVWDSQFAPSPGQNLQLADVESNPALRLLHQSQPLAGQTAPYVSLFEVTSASNEGAPNK